jgi:mRNA interferase HicA
MKRKEFIRKLEQQGCFLLRHGSNHDIYINPKNKNKQPVPRHTEIDDRLAKHIIKYLGLQESNEQELQRT